MYHSYLDILSFWDKLYNTRPRIGLFDMKGIQQYFRYNIEVVVDLFWYN